MIALILAFLISTALISCWVILPRYFKDLRILDPNNIILSNFLTKTSVSAMAFFHFLIRPHRMLFIIFSSVNTELYVRSMVIGSMS
jgi:hypothetical protein